MTRRINALIIMGVVLVSATPAVEVSVGAGVTVMQHFLEGPDAGRLYEGIDAVVVTPLSFGGTLFAELALLRFLALEPSLRYRQVQTEGSSRQFVGPGTHVESSLTHSSTMIAFLTPLKVGIGRRFRAFALGGPVVLYRLTDWTQSVYSSLSDGTVLIDDSDVVEGPPRFGYGAEAGFGIEFALFGGKLGWDIRRQFGFTEWFANDPDNDYPAVVVGGAEMTVRYQIPLN